jgi:hypothetical protein
MFYMDSDSSSSPSGWSPARRSPTKRKSPSRPPREFFDGRNYCWGEPVTRTHVPTGKIRVVKGVEVEIPAIRFMLEFRTPASASG